MAPASGRGPAAGEGQAECLLKFETVAAIDCRVHDANLFYRVEKKTGIKPCGSPGRAGHELRALRVHCVRSISTCP